MRLVPRDRCPFSTTKAPLLMIGVPVNRVTDILTVLVVLLDEKVSVGYGWLVLGEKRRGCH